MEFIFYLGRPLTKRVRTTLERIENLIIVNKDAWRRYIYPALRTYAFTIKNSLEFFQNNTYLRATNISRCVG